MKFLIVLAYYERPNLVRNALESIRDQGYDDWHLAFIDDGSVAKGAPIVGEVFGPRLALGRFTFFNSFESPADKKALGGSCHGALINKAIHACPGDVVVVLCDDDALMPQGLSQLAEWYEQNDEAMYAWSRVRQFDPTQTKPHLGIPETTGALNRHKGTIDPVCQVDSSQVTFRRGCVTLGGCRYPERMTAALDAEMFKQLKALYGLCPATDTELQYKAIWPGQLGNRKGDALFAAVDV